MTPRQAADVIGCTPRNVLKAIQSGRLRARRVTLPSGAYYYEITQDEAERYRDQPQGPGWPRGVARS